MSFSLVLSQGLFAQNNNKIAPQTEIYYSASSSTDDIQSLTKEQPQKSKITAEKQNLLNQLEEARTTNNIAEKEKIETLLDNMNGSTPVPLIENPDVRGGAVTGVNDGPTDDYQTSLVMSGAMWSSATQTSPGNFPNPGTIWVAGNMYSGTGADTCKIFLSTNGGQNWTFAYWYYFNTNMDFRAHELDIELMYDGSVVWIYGVAGYLDLNSNRTYSLLFRFNTTTNVFNGYTLTWPGSANTGNMYYNPRLTSDNSYYTTSSYVYLLCAFDSAYGTSGHFNRQKFAHLANPFAATPTITYSQPSTNGGFYWNTATAPANSFLWSDIAYFKTAANYDRIITVYNASGAGNYNLYLAWSDDYGASITGNQVLLEANVDYGAKLAFNGGPSNLNGMITYVRQFSSTDWDPYCRSTTDGGTNWVSGYIDGSTNRARTIDIYAPRGANNVFKVAYNQDSTSGNYAYYTGGSNGSWNSPYPTVISPTGTDTIFSRTIAGSKIGGGDECFALFSSGSGANIYASRLCQNSIGIHNINSEVPNAYSLSQNYPNPFNPTTSINFSLPKKGMVKLIIYGILGNEVETLENGTMEAGNYIVDFNASSLSSGVYFYKLTAGDFTSTKKMLLIK